MNTTKARNERTQKVFDLDHNNPNFQAGKRAGSILPRAGGKFLAKITINNITQNKLFTNEQQADEWLTQLSNENNLIKNRIKICDNNIIQVELEKDVIMKTNLQFLDIVQKHVISLKNKKYAIIRVDSKQIPFQNFITGNKKTFYINSDTLDNRLENLTTDSKKVLNNIHDFSNITSKECKVCRVIKDLDCFSKHSGTKDKLDARCKECVAKVKTNQRENDIESKVYRIIPLDYSNKNWQVGKRAGTILKKNGKFEARIMIDGTQRSKRCGSEEEADQWLFEMSNEHGLTRNRIKIISKNVIQVELTKGYVMKTDLKFSDLVQQHTIVAGKGGGNTSKDYAIISINKNIYFHNYITGNKMSDHINRDPMDNRLINLRAADHKLNNNNRGLNKAYMDKEDHIMGVRYVEKDHAFQARIKQDGKEITKSFGINTYGHERAKQLATEYREKLCRQYNSNNTNTL